jgi:hypothetical protein
LLLRIRPDSTNFIENGIEKPYEVHLVSFEAQEDFENFKLDENRKNFLYLKEQSIKEAILIQGVKL